MIPSSKSQRLADAVKVLLLFPVVTVLIDDDGLDPSSDCEDCDGVGVAIVTRSGGSAQEDVADKEHEDVDCDRDGIKSNERDGDEDREESPKLARLFMLPPGLKLAVLLSVLHDNRNESSTLRLERR